MTSNYSHPTPPLRKPVPNPAGSAAYAPVASVPPPPPPPWTRPDESDNHLGIGIASGSPTSDIQYRQWSAQLSSAPTGLPESRHPYEPVIIPQMAAQAQVPVPPMPSNRPPPVPSLPLPNPLASHPVSVSVSAEPNGSHHQHARLRKEHPPPAQQRPRSSSYNHAVPQLPVPGSRSSSPAASEARGRTGRSSSAQPPAGRGSSSRPPTAQSPAGRAASRPDSRRSNGSQSPPVDVVQQQRLKKSWLPGGRSRSNSQDMSQPGNMQAWILSSGGTAEYKTHLLARAEKVPELWDENGTVYVYLHPRASGCGPSFRVPDSVIRDSLVFQELLVADSSPTSGRSRARSFGGRDSLSAEDAVSRRFSPPNSPPIGSGTQSPGEQRLYLPTPASNIRQLVAPGQLPPVDLERQIAVRNLFAFLTGQPLVATKAHPTAFAVFLQIAALLQEFWFTSPDGASFGAAVELSFGFFVGQLGLADVRHSREKTLEALVLGERMRSLDLYSEAFAHAVGKYSAIVDIKSPLFEQVSVYTRQRLERAHIDLTKRLHNVNNRLEKFDFPSLFAGIATSTSHPELRHVRFKIWAKSFEKMRAFVLSYYKGAFGSWPPKARSKKNPFSESGLNRLVLKVLYSDFCALYDLIVNRKALTPRVIDGVPEDVVTSQGDDPSTIGLRKILSEFDHSQPPVLPPIPFDVPLMPSLSAVSDRFHELSPKEQAKLDKKLKGDDLARVLKAAYNADTNAMSVPFLKDFKDFEAHEAKGRTAADAADQRIGHWLFMYVVIQCLPMLVVDAPGLKFGEGVEYFLCEPPMGHPPWLAEDASGAVRKVWYEVAGGSSYVELSADAVMFSVEATYHRSHCWLAARRWEGLQGADAPPPTDALLSPLEPPPRAVFGDGGSGMGAPSPPVQSPTLTIDSPPAVMSPALSSHGATPPPLTLPLRDPSPAARGRLPSRGSANRSSIALGLEPVVPPFLRDDGGSLPPPLAATASSDSLSFAARGGPGQHMRSSSTGPQLVGPAMRRNFSAGNLRGAFANRHSVYTESTTDSSVTSGVTFDDILAKQPQKMKKKSRFFS